ncbi:NF-kappa-B inhibitor zeta isoform X2 [Mugil cephalus]|uniref:NF-kappa-B inhibitor zeta isoform X2 n=1 Tax=Mugil cephalus TaxID=48193 RepID=UPI001FB80B0C|nr:NF-kappa-B inhibitor zeta isoform X2 [Mugil cephalus]
MLDPRVNESRGALLDYGQACQGFLMAETKPGQGCFPVSSAHKKNTVKELLMMRRRAVQNGSQNDDNNNHVVHKFKSAKYQGYPSDLSPHHVSPHHVGPPYSPEEAHGQMVPVPLPYADPQWPEATLVPPAPLVPQSPPAPEVKVTLFHWQIKQETQKVEGLCDERLNAQDSDGDTFLHIAVAQGKRALAYVLAARMAGCGTLDLKEHNGQTPLQIAAATNQHLILQDLLSHGAQINTRDFWGRSPLHVCAQKGHLSSLQSMWKSLNVNAMDIEMFSYDGLTPLHLAVLAHNAVVKEMRCLENPCSYMTMELAQKKKRFEECVQTLLQMGASYATKDLKSGRTCLHMAAEEANIEVLGVLLDQSSSLAVVNVKTFSGNTALHIVSSLQCHTNQLEAVKLLMRKGADPGIRNIENELPSQLAPDGPVGEKVTSPNTPTSTLSSRYFR